MIRKHFILPLTTLIMLFTLTSCAVYNTDIDRQLGEQNSLQIEQQMGLYKQQSILEYVEAVGKRLVDQLEQPEFNFQFNIVDDAVPNAFALPGGYIYISRGLLALMVSEDELANVLAHEIIHVTERHTVKQMHTSILPSLIELPGNLVGGLVNENLGQIINAPISASNDLLLSGYGRGHETESDEKGIALAAKAGYQPQQMATILARLNNAVELSTQQKQQKSYFDSHPYTPDRITHINKTLKKITTSPKTNISDDFIASIDNLLYGENPAKGVFIGQQFLHPELDFVIDFPQKWTLVNQPQAVIAFDEKEQSFVALSVTNNQKNALQNAQSFEQQINKNSREEIKYQPVSFDWGATGYLVSFQDNRQKQETNIELLWVDLNGLTYQVSSMGKSEFQEQITRTSVSLRPILEEEKSALTKQVIHRITAQQGETLSTLAERENNTENIDYIALINDQDPQQKLDSEQSFKLIITVPYID